MKKTFFAVLAALFMFSCSDYDDSGLKKDIKDLKERVTKLEELCKTMNTDINSLKSVVDALNTRDYVMSVDELRGGSGYEVTFARTGLKFISVGKNTNENGDGSGGPVLGIALDKGIYYWTFSLSGQTGWLLDTTSNKIRVSGEDGHTAYEMAVQNGFEGSYESWIAALQATEVITPVIGVNGDGYWTMSYDNGTTFSKVMDANGEPVKAVVEGGKDGQDGQDGIFKAVYQDNNSVYFVLQDETIIAIAKKNTLDIVFDFTEPVPVYPGQTYELNYTITGGDQNTLVEAIPVAGNYSAVVRRSDHTSGKIVVNTPSVLDDGRIIILVSDGADYTIMRVVYFTRGIMSVVTDVQEFEAEGGRLTIKLYTNLDFTINIPSQAMEWIVASLGTRSIREEISYFDVMPNQGPRREAVIEVKDSRNGEVLQSVAIIQKGKAISFTTDFDTYSISRDGTPIDIHVEVSEGDFGILSAPQWVNVYKVSNRLMVSPNSKAVLYERTGVVTLYSEFDPTQTHDITVIQEPSYSFDDLNGSWTLKSHNASLDARQEANIELQYDALTKTYTFPQDLGNGITGIVALEVTEDSKFRLPVQIVARDSEAGYIYMVVMATSNQDKSTTSYSYWYLTDIYLEGELVEVNGKLSCHFTGTQRATSGGLNDGFIFRAVPGTSLADFVPANSGITKGTSRFENTIEKN